MDKSIEMKKKILHKPLFLLLCVALLQHNCINTMQILEHERTHSEKKPYQCTTCKKSFAQSRYLRRHKLTHSEERPYTCTLCNKKFIQKCHLTEHLLRHSVQKPYHCSTCNKGFIRKNYLIKHKETQKHSKKKALLRTISNKNFDQKSTLTKHKQTDVTEEMQIIPTFIYQPMESLFENNDIHIS